MNKAWRRQSSAEWAARAVTDLCGQNQAWTTGWSRLRARGDAEFREAVEKANELHAIGALFAREIVPKFAPEDPVDWAMAEASDDEDDAPMPDAPPEPELIDMPPGILNCTHFCPDGIYSHFFPEVSFGKKLYKKKTAQTTLRKTLQQKKNCTINW